MKVRDVGMKEVHCASDSVTLNEIASMMKRHNVGIIPICDGEKLIGIITDRDMVVGCMAAGKNAKGCKASDFMTSDPITVSPEASLEEAAKIMGEKEIHRLPVVEGGNLVGMISLGDVALALPHDDTLIARTLRNISSPTHSHP